MYVVMNEARLYKFSIIFAIVLHVLLLSFLMVKFKASRSVALGSSGFINATIISERDFNSGSRMAKPKVITQVNKTETSEKTNIQKPSPVIVKKKLIDKKTNLFLQKHLKMEQEKERAELQNNINRQQEILLENQQQQLLEEQIAADEEKLIGTNSLVDVGGMHSDGEVNEYKAKIIQAISSEWIVPDEVDDKAVAQILIKLAPGGAVLSVQLLSSSGSEILDRSAHNAILKASPLPVPESQELFDDFREIKLTFNPKGIIGG